MLRQRRLACDPSRDPNRFAFIRSLALCSIMRRLSLPSAWPRHTSSSPSREKRKREEVAPRVPAKKYCGNEKRRADSAAEKGMVSWRGKGTPAVSSAPRCQCALLVCSGAQAAPRGRAVGVWASPRRTRGVLDATALCTVRLCCGRLPADVPAEGLRGSARAGPFPPKACSREAAARTKPYHGRR